MCAKRVCLTHTCTNVRTCTHMLTHAHTHNCTEINVIRSPGWTQENFQRLQLYPPGIRGRPAVVQRQRDQQHAGSALAVVLCAATRRRALQLAGGVGRHLHRVALRVVRPLQLRHGVLQLPGARPRRPGHTPQRLHGSAWQDREKVLNHVMNINTRTVRIPTRSDWPQGHESFPNWAVTAKVDGFCP